MHVLNLTPRSYDWTCFALFCSHFFLPTCFLLRNEGKTDVLERQVKNFFFLAVMYLFYKVFALFNTKDIVCVQRILGQGWYSQARKHNLSMYTRKLFQWGQNKAPKKTLLPTFSLSALSYKVTCKIRRPRSAETVVTFSHYVRELGQK